MPRTPRTPRIPSARAIAAVEDLGDSSSDSDSSFRSPELRPDQTDYQLQYEGTETPRRSMRQVPDANIDTPTAAQRTTSYVAKKSTSRSTRNIEMPSTSRFTATTRSLVRQTKPPRKQKTPAQRNLKFFKEVQRLQKTTDFLIPRLPFSRLVREILTSCGADVSYITKEAFEALQTATEYYMTQQFEDAYMLTLHRNRVTLGVVDMRFLRYLFSKHNIN